MAPKKAAKGKAGAKGSGGNDGGGGSGADSKTGADGGGGGSDGQTTSAEQTAYRVQTLEATVESLRERLKRLTHDNEELKNTKDKVEKDTHEFVAYFQKEMEKKDDLVADLRYNLRQLEISRERETRELKEDFAAQLTSKQNQLANTDRELRMRVKSLEEELNVLFDFKAHKRELESKLHEQAQQLLTKDVEHQQALADLERKFLEEKARMQKEYERDLAKIKKKSREEAQKGLDADTRRIITDNRRMGEELKFQLQTTDELQVAKTEMEEVARRYKQEVALYSEKEAEYARAGQRKAREIKELTAQVQTLERSMNQMVRDFEREKQQMAEAHKSETEELKLEVHGLKQLVRLKTKELTTIKKLAQTILGQRTEVEQFFIEALQTVKAEIQNAREEHRRAWNTARSRGDSKLPGVSPRGGSASGRRPGSDKVELRDLSAEDRERVLRLLFAKINGVQSYAAQVEAATTDMGSREEPDQEFDLPSLRPPFEPTSPPRALGGVSSIRAPPMM